MFLRGAPLSETRVGGSMFWQQKQKPKTQTKPDKPDFKQKFVVVYESLLRGKSPPGHVPPSGAEQFFDPAWEGNRFWDEVFLLKVRLLRSNTVPLDFCIIAYGNIRIMS